MSYTDEVSIPDVSVWQGIIDFDKFDTAVHAFYARATYGLSQDIRWVRNLTEALARGLPIGGYAYLLSHVDGRAQARAFAQALSQGKKNSRGQYVLQTQLRPVVDVEECKTTATVLAENIRKFLDEFYVITGVRVEVVYSRKYFWDPWLDWTNFATFMDLWVAHYSSTYKEPLIPKAWVRAGKKAIMWQWSADKNGKGPQYGTGSRDIDLNRYFGGLAQLKKDYPGLDFSKGPSTPAPDPEPPQENDKVLAEIMHVQAKAGLNIRNNIKPSIKWGRTPGMTYRTSTIYFTAPFNTPVAVLEVIVDGKNRWARTGLNQYAAIEYDGVTYLA